MTHRAGSVLHVGITTEKDNVNNVSFVLSVDKASAHFLGDRSVLPVASTRRSECPGPSYTAHHPVWSNTQVSGPISVGGQTQYDITGGTRPGGGTNLFHSFGDFNVPNNNIANFLNETGYPHRTSSAA